MWIVVSSYLQQCRIILKHLALEFQNDVSHRKVLSSIHNFITMDKFLEEFYHPLQNCWRQEYSKRYEQQEKKSKPKTIHRSMYPILLEKLTGKPQFLFQFLKLESSLLFGGRDWQAERDSIRTEKKEDT